MARSLGDPDLKVSLTDLAGLVTSHKIGNARLARANVDSMDVAHILGSWSAGTSFERNVQVTSQSWV